MLATGKLNITELIHWEQCGRSEKGSHESAPNLILSLDCTVFIRGSVNLQLAAWHVWLGRPDTSTSVGFVDEQVFLRSERWQRTSKPAARKDEM